MTLLGNGIEESLIPHHINLTQVSQVSTEDYHKMIEIIKGVKEDGFDALGLEPCSIENELNKVRAKTESPVSKEVLVTSLLTWIYQHFTTLHSGKFYAPVYGENVLNFVKIKVLLLSWGQMHMSPASPSKSTPMEETIPLTTLKQRRHVLLTSPLLQLDDVKQLLKSNTFCVFHNKSFQGKGGDYCCWAARRVLMWNKRNMTDDFSWYLQNRGIRNKGSWGHHLK